MSDSKENGNSTVNCFGCGGFSIGSFIAIILSWDMNHSWLWAAIHGICGWFYIAYYLIVYKLF